MSVLFSELSNAIHTLKTEGDRMSDADKEKVGTASNPFTKASTSLVTVYYYIICFIIIIRIEAIYSIGLIPRNFLGTGFFGERTFHDVLIKAKDQPVIKETFEFVKRVQKAKTPKGIEKAFIMTLLIKHRLGAFHKELSTNLQLIKYNFIFCYS